MKKVLLVSLALLALAFFALPAMATVTQVSNLVTPDSGHYDINGLFYAGGAPIRLFEPPDVPPAPNGNPPDTSLLWGNNNTSPLNGPGYPNYLPSPGSAGGEAFDIEGLIWRYNPGNNNLMVWVVSSVPPQDSTNGFNGVPWEGNHYLVGDVFINTTGGSSYNYALISFGNDAPNTAPGDNEAGHGAWAGSNRNAGDLVALDGDETLYGINGPNGYEFNTTIQGEANPWAVMNPDDIVSDPNLVYQELTETDSPGIEALDDPRWGSLTGPTFVSFFDVFVDLSTTELDNLMNPNAWHVSVQCGNDEAGGSSGPGGGGEVPVPGALILGIIGAGLVGLRRRMKA